MAARQIQGDKASGRNSPQSFLAPEGHWRASSNFLWPWRGPRRGREKTSEPQKSMTWKKDDSVWPYWKRGAEVTDRILSSPRTHWGWILLDNSLKIANSAEVDAKQTHHEPPHTNMVACKPSSNPLLLQVEIQSWINRIYLEVTNWILVLPDGTKVQNRGKVKNEISSPPTTMLCFWPAVFVGLWNVISATGTDTRLLLTSLRGTMHGQWTVCLQVPLPLPAASEGGGRQVREGGLMGTLSPPSTPTATWPKEGCFSFHLWSLLCTHHLLHTPLPQPQVCTNCPSQMVLRDVWRELSNQRNKSALPWWSLSR